MQPQEIKRRLGLEKFTEQPDLEELMKSDSPNAYYACNAQKQLIGLNLCGQELTDDKIAFLWETPRLQALNLSENKLTAVAIPARMKDLIYLNLSENKSLQTATFSEGLPALEELDISECSLKELVLPKGFSALKTMDFRKNELAQVDFEGDCPALVSLDLSQNQLDHLDLPDGFGQLAYLYLNDNKLRRLHMASVLPRLETLHLRNNQLEELPANFLGLRSLETLYLYKNPLSSIPPEFISEGERGNSLEKVKNYLLSLAQAEKVVENDEVKLVLLGNSTSGKSSLLRLLKGEEFDEDIESTHGINNEIWEPEGSAFKVNIWDFGGQEFYHATHRLFLSKNALSLVLFEKKTNLQGIKQTLIRLYEDGRPVKKNIPVEHFPYAYWLVNLRYFCGRSETPITYLVQNKMDISEEAPVSDFDRKKYQLRDKQIFRLSVKNAYPKKNDEYSLLQFKLFEKNLIDRLSETKSKYSFDEKWLEIKTQLRALSPNKVIFSRREFTDFCEKISPGISNNRSSNGDSILDTLTDYLHDIGVILHYPGIPELRDTVFVQPTWVTDVIYKVLDYSVMRRDGKFDQAHVGKILGQLKESLGGFDAEQIIALMKQFELIFAVKKPTRTIFVAPQYLSRKRPEKLEYALEYVNLVPAFVLYYPNFLPRSAMLRFIARFGFETYENLVWRDGIAFGKPLALVECNYDKRQIQISVQDSDSEVMRQIFGQFQEINRANSDIQVSVNGRDFVKIGSLLTHPRENKVIVCENGAKFEFRSFAKLLSKDGHSFLEIKPAVTPKRIFFMYSTEDADYRNEFDLHLAQLKRDGYVKTWYDGRIKPGEDWDEKIKEQLAQTEVFLLLISPHFMNSKYIWEVELKAAQEKSDQVSIVPVFLRACDTEGAWFMQKQGAGQPKNWIASIQSSGQRDEKWLEVINQLKRIIKDTKDE